MKLSLSSTALLTVVLSTSVVAAEDISATAQTQLVYVSGCVLLGIVGTVFFITKRSLRTKKSKEPREVYLEMGYEEIGDRWRT